MQIKKEYPLKKDTLLKNVYFKRLDRSSILAIRTYEKSNGAIIFYRGRKVK